ncbi:MAG: phosphodiester glycosidase family protein [Muribaculaceae bacterium]|nr:phosphodiester glycosidase family protein [Muribaculaceae bacterium]
MKKLFITFLFGCCALFAAQASGSIMLSGETYAVDTLFHNQVGPGTTQTSLWLHNDLHHLRVFYSTMDMTNPYLSLHGVSARDKLAGNETISSMAKRKSQPGQRYFVGINGDFFATSGTTSRGVSVVGSPVGSTVCDGDIYRTRYNATSYKNFIVDEQGALYINPFRYSGTVTAPDGATVALGDINNEAGSNNNAVTIYNDLYYGSTNEFSGCEVTATVATGETFKTAGSFHMVITGTPSTGGDMTIPDGAYVIHGHGSAASFVQNLKEGDVIQVDATWTCGGLSVVPTQVVSGNPKILADGEILNSEGDRGDASQLHPRTGIGYSDGGNTVYFCVVDGRSPISNGVRTTALAAIMKYAGATDAMNLDGGGSSILYTSALGTRNKPSDGTERADGNAFYCVSSAPDDDVVAAIRFQNFNLNLPQYGIFTPHFYGYNQYGMLIDTDVKGVMLTCPESLGTILNDSTLYITGTGVQTLTATLGDAVVTMPVVVSNAVDDIAFTYKHIINDGLRNYTVQVQTTVNGQVMTIGATALTWHSENPDIVTVDEHTGTLRGLRNGEAIVIGTLGEVADTLTVTVEIPEAHVMTADDFDPATWSISQRVGNGGHATALDGGGLRWDYTSASGRLPRLLLEKGLRLWSMPDTLRLHFNPGTAPVKQIQFGLYAGDNRIAYATVTPTAITPEQDMVIDLPMAQWMNLAEVGNYPITLASIDVGMNATSAGQELYLTFNKLETVYASVPAMPALTGDTNGDGKVDVEDVNQVINFILQATSFEPQASSDVTGDGKIDVEDVNAIINIILKIS